MAFSVLSAAKSDCRHNKLTFSQSKLTDETEVDFSCLQAIEKNLASQLLEFQKYGVAFGISHKGRCLVADDMGLGWWQFRVESVNCAEFMTNESEFF